MELVRGTDAGGEFKVEETERFVKHIQTKCMYKGPKNKGEVTEKGAGNKQNL